MSQKTVAEQAGVAGPGVEAAAMESASSPQAAHAWQGRWLAARLRAAAAQLEAGQLLQVVLITKQDPAFLNIDHICRPFGDEGYFARCPAGAAKVVEHLLNGYQPDIHDQYQRQNQRPFTCRAKPLD